nr:MAG TPA: hypothetical protein [Caudoviricetes sp.]
MIDDTEKEGSKNLNDIELNGIADDLLNLNKITVDRLFQLENCADCIALYVFYYKTAKWQKTNTVKANDQYVKKSLKWGISKIQKTKQTLKEHGLIDIVQRRKDGKIEGWFIKVSYFVSERKADEIKINVQESNNTQKQQVENCTSGSEETNALKEKIKCLEKELEMLKDNKKERKPKKQTKSYDEQIAGYTQNEELQDALKAFVQMRAFIKSPVTEQGVKLLLNKLTKISRNDAEKITIVNNSIENNWKGFYGLKEETKSVQPEKKYDQNGYESEEEFMKMFYGK